MRGMSLSSVWRQPSYNSVANSAATSGLRGPSATGSSSYASTIRPRENTSLNNNANPAATESTSASGLTEHPGATSCRAVELPVQILYPHQPQGRSDSGEVKQSSPPVQNATQNVEPTRRPDVPRPLTPIPEVHRATMASSRLPHSVPLADFLISPRTIHDRNRNVVLLLLLFGLHFCSISVSVSWLTNFSVQTVL